ncbi:MAG: cation diffusion facilitator family transporter [Planctomycetota bacterium]
MMSDSIELRNTVIKKTTTAGIITNISLAVIKISAGIFANSQTVLADGIHSLSDLFTDFGVLFGVRFWSKPRDDNHPYGHGRIEQVIAVCIGLILAATSLGIIYNALSGIENSDFTSPGLAALIASIVSIIAKEVLYKWTAKNADSIKSPALLANAWHHRSDAISSVPAAVAVAAALLYRDWHFIDHIGAVIVSIIILHASAKIIFPSINQLVDTAPPEKIRNAVMAVVKGDPDVKSAHKLRTRYIGPGIAVDIHVLVDPDLSVKAGHNIAENVSAEVKNMIPEVVDMVVHIEPF